MSKYWKDRYTKTSNEMFSKAETEVNKELAKQYQLSANRTKAIIESLYVELHEATEDGTLLTSDLYKYDKYYKVLEQINRELNRLGSKEIKLLDKKFKAYYQNNANYIGDQLGLDHVTNEQALQTLESIWCSDGKDWNSRIWTNKKDLQMKLEQGMVDAITQGKSYAKITKDISDTFSSVGFSNAERLVRTELSYIQNKSAVDRYKEAGVEKYEINAESDCCEECAELSTQQFNIDEIVLPAHPNCRCCAIPVIK